MNHLNREYCLSDFDFTLPTELIAQYPPAQRNLSRLLCLNSKCGTLIDRTFLDLPSLLRPGDLLVLNDTKVMRARIYGRKATGSRVELLIERLESPYTALAHLRANKACRIGSSFFIENDLEINIIGRIGDLFQLQAPIPFIDIMTHYGQIPLPPYIKRSPDILDETRYQTVYAKRDGAVAAPTAGLHFDADLIASLSKQGVAIANVTLHVGAGTFQPVRSECLDEHVMHSEWCEVSSQVCTQIMETKALGGRVIAVGTTSVRSLESAAFNGSLKPYNGETRLFIRPGYKFRVVDMLITNFHLPCSTLLMLVCAFGGMDSVLNAYQHAITSGYRFFSYGDAMLLNNANIK